MPIHITEDDLHPHLEARMRQRGVTLDEIRQTLLEGGDAPEAKPGTLGKVMACPYNAYWEGRFYREKQVTVYYKAVQGKKIVLLTVLARYGQDFSGETPR